VLIGAVEPIGDVDLMLLEDCSTDQIGTALLK